MRAAVAALAQRDHTAIMTRVTDLRLSARASELHTARQGTIDDEVRSCDEAGGATCEKYDCVRHLLRRTHPARGIERKRRLVEFGIVVLDGVPDTAFEIGVARRDRVGADALVRELIGETLRVVDDDGFEGAEPRRRLDATETLRH